MAYPSLNHSTSRTRRSMKWTTRTHHAFTCIYWIFTYYISYNCLPLSELSTPEKMPYKHIIMYKSLQIYHPWVWDMAVPVFLGARHGWHPGCCCHPKGRRRRCIFRCPQTPSPRLCFWDGSFGAMKTEGSPIETFLPAHWNKDYSHSFTFNFGRLKLWVFIRNCRNASMNDKNKGNSPCFNPSCVSYLSHQQLPTLVDSFLQVNNIWHYVSVSENRVYTQL